MLNSGKLQYSIENQLEMTDGLCFYVALAQSRFNWINVLLDPVTPVSTTELGTVDVVIGPHTFSHVRVASCQLKERRGAANLTLRFSEKPDTHRLLALDDAAVHADDTTGTIMCVFFVQEIPNVRQGSTRPVTLRFINSPPALKNFVKKHGLTGSKISDWWIKKQTQPMSIETHGNRITTRGVDMDRKEDVLSTIDRIRTFGSGFKWKDEFASKLQAMPNLGLPGISMPREEPVVLKKSASAKTKTIKQKSVNVGGNAVTTTTSTSLKRRPGRPPGSTSKHRGSGGSLADVSAPESFQTPSIPSPLTATSIEPGDKKYNTRGVRLSLTKDSVPAAIQVPGTLSTIQLPPGVTIEQFHAKLKEVRASLAVAPMVTETPPSKINQTSTVF